MNRWRAVVGWVIRTFFNLLCKVDTHQLVKFPYTGPLIMITNHINSAEIPILYTNFQPRTVIGVAKVESWKNPLFNFLFNLWQGIPIRRGEADMEAIRKSLDVLAKDGILAIAPEGTRNITGRLVPGHPGIVLIAVRSGAPILPIAHYGIENFWVNLRHFRRTPFKMVVGNPFRVNAHGQALSRSVRDQMTNEIMYQLAALLPPAYQGVYNDFSKATQEFIEFDPGVKSNLERINLPGSIANNPTPESQDLHTVS